MPTSTTCRSNLAFKRLDSVILLLGDSLSFLLCLWSQYYCGSTFLRRHSSVPIIRRRDRAREILSCDWTRAGLAATILHWVTRTPCVLWNGGRRFGWWPVALWRRRSVFFGMKWREIGSLVLSFCPVASTKDVKEEPQPTITENGRRVSLGYTSVIQIYWLVLATFGWGCWPHFCFELKSSILIQLGLIQTKAIPWHNLELSSSVCHLFDDG